MEDSSWMAESNLLGLCHSPMKCFCSELIVCSVFRTRDMAINSKTKSNHHPRASDCSKNVSFSLDSKKPQTLPGTAYLFQVRVWVYFDSSEPFLATPVAEAVKLYTNLWANCLTSSQQMHCSLQQQYCLYTAGTMLCAKKGEARGNECNLGWYCMYWSSTYHANTVHTHSL